RRLRPERGLREQSPSRTKISATLRRLSNEASHRRNLGRLRPAGDRSSLSSTVSSDDAALPRRG
ncbi:MAG: hypothetical protein ABI810_11135, partial [Sphingomonas bacterium]